MSRLAELRAKKKAPRTDEKKFISLETEVTEVTKAPPFWHFCHSHSGKYEVFSPSAMAVAPQLDATAPLPAPKDRRCYQCQQFQRSPYGFPLGLCRQHGMPEGSFSDVRGNRIQHAPSQPARFRCVSFELRAPETNLCTACWNYHPVSPLCRVVNTGCPYPAIPPCTGAHFQPKAARP